MSRLRLAGILAGALFLCAPAFAASRPDAEDDAMRAALRKVPPPNGPLVVRLPEPKTWRLRNGLRLLMLEDHRLPTVALTMRVRAGSFFEPPDRQGLAALTAAMLDEGAGNRAANEIGEQVDAMGASLSTHAEQGGPMAVIRVSGFSEDVPALMALLADVARRPTFPAAPLEKAIRQAVADVARAESNPNALAEAVTLQALYSDTPPARTRPPVPGLEALTPEDLEEFHATWYRPERAILGITGDIRPEDARRMVEAAFGDWERGNAPLEASLPRYAPARTSRVIVVDRPGSVQTVLQLSNLGIRRHSRDYAAMAVLNHILGGAFTSRLWTTIREEKGYAYSVGSTFTAPRYTGHWSATAQVRTEVTAEAVSLFLDEFQRLRRERVSSEELDGAKQGILGLFARQVEDPGEVLDNALDVPWYGLPDDNWRRLLQRVRAVSADDVRRVARRYLVHPQIVAVGERTQIEGALARFGPAAATPAPEGERRGARD